MADCSDPNPNSLDSSPDLPTEPFPLPDPKHLNSIIYPENQLADDGLNEPDPEEPDDDEEFEAEDAEEDEEMSLVDKLVERIMTEEVELRVHDYVILGNTKTKDSVIEGQLDRFKQAKTLQEILMTGNDALETLKELQIFDSVIIALLPGPINRPGTVNVVVDVVETEGDMISGKFGFYTKPAATCIAEGSLQFKNVLGYGDLWDGSLAYGPQTSEVGASLLLPRIKGFVAPRKMRVFLLSQGWMKLSSYKERMAGLSLNLFSSTDHEIVYNLGWCTIADPSEMASRSIKRQLGSGLHSSLTYTFTCDGRINPLSRTHGWSFVSSFHVGGLAPESHCARFIRQESDLRYAVPFGFCGAVLKFGLSVGAILPLRRNGFLRKPSSLPETFFLGGDSSPALCSFGGPSSAVREFKTKGLDPTEPRRHVRGNSSAVQEFKTKILDPTKPRRHVRDSSKYENSESLGRDFVGDEMAVSAFANISFDLPFPWLKERGIRGHVFAGAENAAKLSRNEFRKFNNFQRFVGSFQTSVGAGIVIPVKKILLECNYYYMLNKLDRDGGKTGFRFSISPS